jgi:hypothetical protein
MYSVTHPICVGRPHMYRAPICVGARVCVLRTCKIRVLTRMSVYMYMHYVCVLYVCVCVCVSTVSVGCRSLIPFVCTQTWLRRICVSVCPCLCLYVCICVSCMYPSASVCPVSRGISPPGSRRAPAAALCAQPLHPHRSSDRSRQVKCRSSLVSVVHPPCAFPCGSFAPYHNLELLEN